MTPEVSQPASDVRPPNRRASTGVSSWLWDVIVSLGISAFIIETGDESIPLLCHAPTMRVPGSIEGTDKVYSATWAALLAVHAHNLAVTVPIKTAAFPGMEIGRAHV